MFYKFSQGVLSPLWQVLSLHNNRQTSTTTPTPPQTKNKQKKHNLLIPAQALVFCSKMWKDGEVALTLIGVLSPQFRMNHCLSILCPQLTFCLVSQLMEGAFQHILRTVWLPFTLMVSFSTGHSPQEHIMEGWNPHSPPFQVCAYSLGSLHCCKQQR